MLEHEHNIIVLDKNTAQLCLINTAGKIIFTKIFSSTTAEIEDIYLYNATEYKNCTGSLIHKNFYCLSKQRCIIVKYDNQLNEVARYHIKQLHYIDDIKVDYDNNLYAISKKQNLFIKMHLPTNKVVSAIRYPCPTHVFLSTLKEPALYNNIFGTFTVFSAEYLPKLRFTLNTLGTQASWLSDILDADPGYGYALYPTDKKLICYRYRPKVLLPEKAHYFSGQPISILEINSTIFVVCTNPSSIYYKPKNTQKFTLLKQYGEMLIHSGAKLSAVE